MARTKASAEAPITIPKLDLRTIKVRVVGDSPLICHRWSDTAKNAILDKQMRKARAGREIRDPDAEYRESLYGHPAGGYGFPTVAFKQALVGAARFVPDTTMTSIRGAVHFVGELVKIIGEPSMRGDTVRVGMGSADLRFRGEFKEWQADLLVPQTPSGRVVKVTSTLRDQWNRYSHASQAWSPSSPAHSNASACGCPHIGQTGKLFTAQSISSSIVRFLVGEID